MPDLNEDGIAEIEKEKKQRIKDLEALVSKPFDLNNKEQLLSLKKYIDNFELSVNRMYLYQASSQGIKAFATSWVVGRFLPFPEFVSSILALLLYLGTAGYILKNASMTDFYNQLEEMKTLYCWCMKDSNATYNEQIENTDKLANPNIQRLIQLIAPLCTINFMVAWPKLSAHSDAPSGLLSSGLSIAGSVVGLFYNSTPKTKVNHSQIHDLKFNVENRKYDVDVFNGLAQSIKYFSTSPEFREMLTNKLTNPVNLLEPFIPSLLGQFAKK